MGGEQPRATREAAQQGAAVCLDHSHASVLAHLSDWPYAKTTRAPRDGWSQGLNRIKEEWSLTFTRSHDVVNDVDDFLTARAGVESFIWTNPRGKAIIVVCDSHTVKRYPGYQVLTATFRQVFES